MKHLQKLLVIAVLALALAACDGATTTSDEAGAAVVEPAAAVADPPVDQAVVAESAAEDGLVTTAVPTGVATGTVSPAVESAELEPAPSVIDYSGGHAITGTDAETGLKINPTNAVTGEVYILRGQLVSLDLTSPDSPEFLLETPDGVRYLIRAQAATELYNTDGVRLNPDELEPGLWAQATAQLDDATIDPVVMRTDNLTIIADNP
jgi:hypothetical protein